MHLPDGILSAPVWIGAGAVTAGALALCVRRASRQLDEQRAPLMGVLGAFVFAAQMINFPVPGGTSGHLMGAVLLAVLLGPASASVVLFCVFLVQSLLFQDGGITALGANFINMGLVGSFGGWAVYRLLEGGGGQARRSLAAFVAAWAAVEAGALLAALQLWASGSAPLTPVLWTMGTVHAFIGIGEGLITVATLRFLSAAHPSLLESVP